MRLQKETNLYKDGAIGDGINDAIQTYDSYFDQTRVFNLLTKNGTAQGIFMVGDQLYINMNYLQTGTLVLGGANNVNGLMVVKDSSGTEIGRWDKDGLTASGQLTVNGSAAKFLVGQRYTYQYSMIEGLVWRNLNSGTLYIKNNAVSKAMVSWTRTSNVYITNNSIYSRAVVVGSDVNDIESGTAPSVFKGMLEYVTQSHYEIRLFNSSGTWNATLSFDSEGMVIEGAWGVSSSYHLSVADGITIRSNSDIALMQAGNYGVEVRGKDPKTSGNCTLTYENRNVEYGANGYWHIVGANTTGNIAVQGSSSMRYKHDISDRLDDELDPHRLYNLPVKQFVFNEDHELQYHDMRDKTLPGFIAEDVDCFYPAATIHDGNGKVENWDERRIIPGMLKLIQEQHEEIERLKQVIHVA